MDFFETFGIYIFGAALVGFLGVFMYVFEKRYNEITKRSADRRTERTPVITDEIKAELSAEDSRREIDRGQYEEMGGSAVSAKAAFTVMIASAALGLILLLIGLIAKTAMMAVSGIMLGAAGVVIGIVLKRTSVGEGDTLYSVKICVEKKTKRLTDNHYKYYIRFFYFDHLSKSFSAHSQLVMRQSYESVEEGDMVEAVFRKKGAELSFVKAEGIDGIG